MASKFPTRGLLTIATTIQNCSALVAWIYRKFPSKSTLEHVCQNSKSTQQYILCHPHLEKPLERHPEC